MAHYAFLDANNVVTEVIVGIDETELIEGQSPEDWYAEFRGQRCVRTSYNGNIRKQYASIGGSYNAVNDVFISEKPYPSWILDENFDWQAPIPMPGEDYGWDEETQQWIEISNVVEE
jgi:hypothetical protein